MYEPLYDEYAGRLHAYCCSLIGEDAPGAVRDAFVSAALQGGPRHPVPARQTELWLYGLARTACLRRTATTQVRPDSAVSRRSADPLLRAAAALRSDQREVLFLSAGDRLEPAEIAALLGIASDTVGQLLQTGRTRLQRHVLDALVSGPVLAEHEHVLAAFEKGTLDALYATRLPAEPPADLRDAVLISCNTEAAQLRHAPASPDATMRLDPVIIEFPAAGRSTDAETTELSGAGAGSGRQRGRKHPGQRRHSTQATAAADPQRDPKRPAQVTAAADMQGGPKRPAQVTAAADVRRGVKRSARVTAIADVRSGRKRPARVVAAAGMAVGVAAAAGLFTTLVSGSVNTGVTQSGSRHVASSGGSSAAPAATAQSAGSPQRSGVSPASSSSGQVNPATSSASPGALPPSATSGRAPQGNGPHNPAPTTAAPIPASPGNPSGGTSPSTTPAAPSSTPTPTSTPSPGASTQSTSPTPSATP